MEDINSEITPKKVEKILVNIYLIWIEKNFKYKSKNKKYEKFNNIQNKHLSFKNKTHKQNQKASKNGENIHNIYREERPFILRNTNQ